METLLHIGLGNALAATVLALLAAVVGRFCRRPALTHGLWLLVLLKLMTPPLWDVRLPKFATTEPAPAPPEFALAPAPPLPSLELEAPPSEAGERVVEALPIGLAADEDVVFPAPETASPLLAMPAAGVPALPAPFAWKPLVAAVWLAGSMLWLALAVNRIGRFGRWLRYARPAPAWLQAETQRLAERLGLGHCPGVWLLPGHLSPMLWCLTGSPRLLLPAELLDRLGDGERATLLLHELAHLRRRDHLCRCLEIVVTALYWWHPVVWWAQRALREAEEQCCDAWVVWALPGAGRTYATALVETVDFLSEARSVLPPVASGLGHVHDLRRRLTMIMRGTTPRALTWGGVLTVLALAALLLPLVPSWGQTPRERGPGEEERRTAKERPDDGARQDEIKRAHVEMEQAQAELAKMKAQLDQAAVHVQQIQKRLHELEGRGPKAERITVIIRDAEGKTRTIEVPPGSLNLPGMPGGPGEMIKRFRIEAEGASGLPGGGAGGRTLGRPGAGGPGGGVDSERRLADLEKKLDAVLHEVENMRREMHPDRSRDKRPDPRPMGGGEGAVPLPGSAAAPGSAGTPRLTGTTPPASGR